MFSSSGYLDHLRTFWQFKKLRVDKTSEVGGDSVELYLCCYSLGACFSAAVDAAVTRSCPSTMFR